MPRCRLSQASRRFHVLVVHDYGRKPARGGRSRGAGIIRAHESLGMAVERHRIIRQSLRQELQGERLLDAIARLHGRQCRLGREMRGVAGDAG